jgi:prepilin-type N-terminal cleavage/methylation domain-containing protein/prepilin-type processing-associated H-X9-DG protein
MKGKASGFTLLEMLLSLAIMAGLASLCAPVLTSATSRAQSAKCVSNLREIGVACFLYAAEHDQSLPVIEPWPSDPVYPASANARPLGEVFGPYGVTGDILKCAKDLSGPNHHAREGSSYGWFPVVNGKKIHTPNFSSGPMPEGLTFSMLAIAFDYANVHGGFSNVLFGDGHVAANGK